MLRLLKFLVAFILPPGLWVVLLMVLAGLWFRRSRQWGFWHFASEERRSNSLVYIYTNGMDENDFNIT